MDERHNHQVKFQFEHVQLLKNQSLGIGSYGAVCKAKCDDLLCAAKIIHPTLIEPTEEIAPQREHRLPIRRFEQECEFMSAIRHPNIVQYLGLIRDADTHLPVLLMELMDDSLTRFLESSTQPIPYHIQVTICHDITLALSFLHSNNIIHRDLSSNNVLLRGNVLAKVTDFGMARLGDITPCFTNTMCPGTDVYMPPEAVQDKPVYTEKIDCFSFGVIMIQILTQQFPKPGDRLQEIDLSHPRLPAGKVLVQVPEVDRRQNHITQIPSNHTLLPVALDCLKDSDSERPSAHQIYERVADLKRLPQFIDSARAIQDKDEVIRTLSVRMEEKDRAVISKEEEIQQLRQQLHEQQELWERGQANNSQLEEKERQLAEVNQQLEMGQQLITYFRRQMAKLEQQLSQPGGSRGKELRLTWRMGKEAPSTAIRYSDAVVDDINYTVYVSDLNMHTAKIFSYDVVTNSWSQLPDCLHTNGSMAAINGWLTVIGGYSYSECTYFNELFSLSPLRENSDRKWIQKFPPMPTKRKNATALCIATTLIVAGGMGVRQVLSTVEVMNTENLQWSTAADLPQPMYVGSATVQGDHMYMLGGVNSNHRYTKSAYTCSISALIQSCNSLAVDSHEAKPNSEASGVVNKTNPWSQIADLPFTQSTCESFHGQLLAVGGYNSGSGTRAVHRYDATTNSWEIVSHMTTGRYQCFTAVHPDNQLIVIGGASSLSTSTSSMEFAFNSCVCI